MALYGVFLIPPADHPFYRLGSDILGYDVWARTHRASALADLTDPASLTRWIGFANGYGLHCTIAGASLSYDPADRDEILERLAWIASRTAPFTLVNGRVDASFHAAPRVLVGGFDSPDGAIQRLHRQVATIISPLRTDSTYAPRAPSLPPHLLEIYQRTGEPWALDYFRPHWSLLVDLPGQEAWDAARIAITERVGLFGDDRTRTLDVTDVHLVEQGDDGYWTVAASFPLTGPTSGA